MAIVDSSFLIARAAKGDRHHDEALAQDLHGLSLIIPSEIWVETAQVLMRQLGPQRAAVMLRSILEGPFQTHAALDAEDVTASVADAARLEATLAKAGLRPLTLYDVIVCRLAQRFKDSILTFDRGIHHVIRQRLFPGARLQ